MYDDMDLFEAKLLALASDATKLQANSLCNWVIENVDKDEWLSCRSMMQYENIDTYSLSESISECGVY